MQAAVLFMLLIITGLAGAPSAIKTSMYTAPLLAELVSCIHNRLA